MPWIYAFKCQDISLSKAKKPIFLRSASSTTLCSHARRLPITLRCSKSNQPGTTSVVYHTLCLLIISNGADKDVWQLWFDWHGSHFLSVFLKKISVTDDFLLEEQSCWQRWYFWKINHSVKQIVWFFAQNHAQIEVFKRYHWITRHC